MMATDIVSPPHLPHGGSIWYSTRSSAPPPTVSLIPATASVSGLLLEPSASVVSLNSNPPGGAGRVGGGGGGGGGNGGGSGENSSSSTGSSLAAPSASVPFVMSADDEKDAAKALVKARPPFWARISSVLRFSHYSPNGPLVTTYGVGGNAENSNCLYILLTLKVGSPAMLPFLNNPMYVGKGFEMLARLQQTFAPSQKSDLYSNFVGLVYLEQGPSDTVEHVASQI